MDNSTEHDTNEHKDAVAVKTNQIVDFVDEGTEQQVDALARTVDIDRTLQHLAFQQERQHTILDFLRRPHLVSSVTWQETQGYNEQLLQLDFPETFTQLDMYREKIQGFVAMRGTIVCELRANPQPFQQGALRMAYVPNAQNMPNKATALLTSLTSFVSLPGVDLRVPMQTIATLRIPFISPQLAVNLVSGEGFYGRLFVHVYSPLVAPTSPSVALSLFVRMEDPQLEFPTGAPIASNFSTIQQNAAEHLKKLPTETARKILETPVYQGVEEMEEQDMKSSGTVTKVLLGASGVATVASLFPPATAIAAPIAAAAAGLAGVTSLFGWSKPTNLSTTQVVKLKGGAHMANSNGEDSSHNMGICAGNHLAPVKGVLGADLDEMSIPVMQSVPAFIRNFSWGTDSVVGSIITRIPVTPVLAAQSASATGVPDFLDLPLMGYIANRFAYWRGDITFTFKVIKTNFHSGRLRFVYVPGFYGLLPEGVDLNKCEAIVLDLRVSDTAQFTCPYVATTPWLMCRMEDNVLDLPTSTQGTAASCCGMLYVEVINELVASDVVAPSVDVLVEVNGDPSLRFSTPRRPAYLPYEPPPPPLDEIPEFQGPEVAPLVPIVRSDFLTGQRAPPIGGNKHTIATDFIPEQATIGETILSLRHLLKRFTLIGASGTNPLTTRSASWSVLPYGKSPIPRGPNASDGIAFDDFSYWSFPYAFARGSMRFKIFADATTGDGVDQISSDLSVTLAIKLRNDFYSKSYQDITDTYAANTSPVNFLSLDRNQAFGPGGDNTQVAVLNVEGGAEFQVPFYSRLHNIALETLQVPSFDNVNKGNIPMTIVTVTPHLRQPVTPATSEYFTTAEFYRAVGDDFSMSFLLAAPRTVRANQFRDDD